MGTGKNECRRRKEGRCSRRNEEDPWKANRWRGCSSPPMVTPIYVTSGEVPWKVRVVREGGRDTCMRSVPYSGRLCDAPLSNKSVGEEIPPTTGLRPCGPLNRSVNTCTQSLDFLVKCPRHQAGLHPQPQGNPPLGESCKSTCPHSASKLGLLTGRSPPSKGVTDLRQRHPHDAIVGVHSGLNTRHHTYVNGTIWADD